MEMRPLMVANIHRCEHRQEEEFDPIFIEPFQEMRIGPHQKRKGLAMAELVIAPFFKPFENRVKATIRIGLQLTENRDVTGISDLLGKIGRVENEFRLEIGIFLRFRQKSQIDANIEVFERVVDKARMAGLIPRHKLEELTNIRVRPALAHF